MSWLDILKIAGPTITALLAIAAAIYYRIKNTNLKTTLRLYVDMLAGSADRVKRLENANKILSEELEALDVEATNAMGHDSILRLLAVLQSGANKPKASMPK